ncbi:MAG: alpha/beta hydrolase [Proteobacteria bacterium]|nr:alpha/beta hydrolase [Pseudomonadota bacterium]
MRKLLRVLGWGLGTVIVVLAVGWLALQRPDIPWPKLEAKYANAQSRWMDLPGGLHVHYRDQGRRDGPTIVLVHGFSASLHAWEPWVQRLGGDYRIITLDLPGHGLTRAPTTYQISPDANADLVDTVARRLGAGRFVIGGNSMGGGVAWNLALRHPEDVRALVLVDAAGWPRPTRRDGPPPLIFALLGNPVGRALIRNIDTHVLAEKGLKSAYVDPALVTPALVDRYVELSRAPGHRDLILAGRQRTGRAITPATFAQIHVPTLVMHGQADALIPVGDGEAFAKAIPGARLVTYPGVGHVPMEQIPDRSAADLGAFLKSLPPPSAG